MERLTYWCDDVQGGGGWRVNVDGLEQSGPHVWRLAAIENILCGEDDKEYDLERLEVILNQRMTMREEVSQRFSVTAKIPVDRLREIVAAERERSAVRRLPARGNGKAVRPAYRGAAVHAGDNRC